MLDAESGTIYAAAASEWLGSAIWRSADLGESWEHSSEGIGYPDEDGGLKLSKVSSVMPAHGRLLVGAESAGLFESTDGGKTFSLVTTFEGQEGREAWNDPAQQPPGHLGLSAIIPHPEERDRFWMIVQGFSLFETTDGGQTWTPRNKGLRRDWPADYEEIGFCVHKVVARRGLRADVPAEPRRHAPLATTPARRGRRSRRACRPSSASPPRRTRTTATPST